MIQVRIVGRLWACVARKAFLFLQMRDDAEALATAGAARRRCIQTRFTANQQITSGRIAGALLARMNSFGLNAIVSCMGETTESNGLTLNF